MNTKLLQQALDALLEYDYAKTDKADRLGGAAIQALRIAIAQPEQPEGDAKDAERYRFLRNALTDSDSTLFVGVDGPDYQGRWALGGDAADKAIDAAIASQKATP